MEFSLSRDINMSRAPLSRIFLCVIFPTAIISIAGCPNTKLVYPELLHYNTFALSEQWTGKYVTTIEVYEKTKDSKPSKESVWMIKATEQIPAEEFIIRVGFTPDGFEQIVPALPQKFEPVDGQNYYIMVTLEPAEKDMFFVLKPWTASSIPEINPPKGKNQGNI
jgi:hypothetical protein